MKQPVLLYAFMLLYMGSFLANNETLLYAQTSPSPPSASEAVFAFPLGEAGLVPFNKICAALSVHPFTVGNFVQTKTISRLKRSLISEGNFIIAQNMGMVWETLKPFPSTLTAGRDYLIQSTPSGTKTRLDARGNETFLRFSDTISAVFSGNSQKLLDNFTVYFTEAEAENSIGFWTIGLVPSEKAIRSFAERIIMSGEAQPGRALLLKVSLQEQNGDSIHYVLSNHRFPASLSPGERALFTLE